MFSERILKGIRGGLRSQHALKELSVRHSGREAMSVVGCMPRRQHGGDPVPSVSEAVPGQPLLLDPGSRGTGMCCSWRMRQSQI